MGMFDTIINSYKPVGKEFHHVPLQTKSLDSCMDTYWINPNGELYKIDLSGCVEFEENPAYNADVDYVRAGMWISPIISVSTGQHGKVSPYYMTKKIHAYTTTDDEYWIDVWFYFKLGQLQTYNTQIRHLSELYTSIEK